MRATKLLIQLGLTQSVADDKSCRDCKRLSRNVRLSKQARTPIDPKQTVASPFAKPFHEFNRCVWVQFKDSLGDIWLTL
jgi:hypothetical protein